MELWEKFEKKICLEFKKNGIPAVKYGNRYHSPKGDVETPEFYIECTLKKFYRDCIRIERKKLEKTLKNAKIRNKIPILVFGDGKRNFALLKFDDLLKLIKTYYAVKKLSDVLSTIQEMVSESTI